MSSPVRKRDGISAATASPVLPPEALGGALEGLSFLQDAPAPVTSPPPAPPTAAQAEIDRVQERIRSYEQMLQERQISADRARQIIDTCMSGKRFGERIPVGPGAVVTLLQPTVVARLVLADRLGNDAATPMARHLANVELVCLYMRSFEGPRGMRLDLEDLCVPLEKTEGETYALLRKRSRQRVYDGLPAELFDVVYMACLRFSADIAAVIGHEGATEYFSQAP